MVFSALLEFAAVSFIGNKPYTPIKKDCLKHAVFQKQKLFYGHGKSTPEGMRLALSGVGLMARTSGCKLPQKKAYTKCMDINKDLSNKEIWTGADNNEVIHQKKHNGTIVCCCYILK